MSNDIENTKVLSAGELQLIAVSHNVNYLVGDTTTVLVRPDADKTTLVLDCEVGFFRGRVGDHVAPGTTDFVLNGAFATDTAWTKGTGWTIAAGVASSDGTQAGDADLTQTPAVALIPGEFYEVIFTVSNYSAGNVTAVVGATEGTDRAANGTFTETIKAGAVGDIDIRADLNFVGDIDNVSVTLGVLGNDTPITQTGGAGSIKIRADREQFQIASPNNFTVVGNDGSAILAYYWL